MKEKSFSVYVTANSSNRYTILSLRDNMAQQNNKMSCQYGKRKLRRMADYLDLSYNVNILVIFKFLI